MLFMTCLLVVCLSSSLQGADTRVVSAAPSAQQNVAKNSGLLAQVLCDLCQRPSCNLLDVVRVLANHGLNLGQIHQKMTGEVETTTVNSTHQRSVYADMMRNYNDDLLLAWLTASAESQMKINRERAVFHAALEGKRRAVIQRYCDELTHDELGALLGTKDQDIGLNGIAHACAVGDPEILTILADALGQEAFISIAELGSQSSLYQGVLRGHMSVIERLHAIFARDNESGTERFVGMAVGADAYNVLYAAAEASEYVPGILLKLSELLTGHPTHETALEHPFIAWAIHLKDGADSPVTTAILNNNHQFLRELKEVVGKEAFQKIVRTTGCIEKDEKVDGFCLWCAALYNNETGLSLFEELIDDGDVFDELLNKRSSAGRTILHYTAERCSKEVIQFLARKPDQFVAWLKDTTYKGRNPFHCAAERDNADTLGAIVKACGEEVSLCDLHRVEENEDGLTPLMLAASKKHVAYIREFAKQLSGQPGSILYGWFRDVMLFKDSKGRGLLLFGPGYDLHGPIFKLAEELLTPDDFKQLLRDAVMPSGETLLHTVANIDSTLTHGILKLIERVDEELFLNWLKVTHEDKTPGEAAREIKNETALQIIESVETKNTPQAKLLRAVKSGNGESLKTCLGNANLSIKDILSAMKEEEPSTNLAILSLLNTRLKELLEQDARNRRAQESEEYCERMRQWGDALDVALDRD